MSQPTLNPNLRERVRRSIQRDPFPDDSRGRARQVLNDLILHLHATKVPVRALKISYSFGLGLLAILFFLVLIVTGVLLLFVYTPTPEDAYASIRILETEIWMGQLVRNLHHWSGNALLIVAALHMLRVFYTAAFHPPREFNWLLGLGLLVLVALSNFTGYLLPWDQLAFWATTIVTGMIGYIPAIGEGLKQWLLGGPEVGGATLRTFFAFHIVVFPLFMAIIVSYHIWRVRKDSFSLPRDLDEPPVDRRQIERVTTIPHLVNLELGFGLLTLALLIAWATWVNAPLEPAANPSHPPNPAKAAWYFMGFQELLLHFHPLIVTLVIPGFTAAALIALPYMDRNPATEPDVEGIWFRSRHGRRLTAINTVLGIVITTAWVILDEKWLDLPELLDFLPVLISDGVIPFGAILLFLIGYHWLLGRRGATISERNLALFTLLCAAFLTLTAIGIFCRGENMALGWPW
ncbi:MAG: cytochrome b N-terminal domain-containing protein [Anaerolineae bacterium]|nr:cytochrome b N-terminal domain-containing protein [Anaerolineae bacterium]